MTTKPLNPQPGDIVHLRAKATEVGDLIECKDGFRNLPTFTLSGINYAALEILAIEPRPLKVGDRVRVDEPPGYGQRVGTILAIHQDKLVAWVEIGESGDFRSLHVSKLTKEP